MARCLLALGSNLGDRQAILAGSCAEVAALPGCELLARSRWHTTLPIGGAGGQQAFLNGALLVETTLQPAELAKALQKIESRLGRQRMVRWDARTIDIDLLLYSAATINTCDLVVPHPRMAFRRFVLEPAAEIAGQMLHPSSGWTLAGLLAHLRNSPRYVVVTAVEQPIADWLVMYLCQTLGCTVWPRAHEEVAVDGTIIAYDNAVGTTVSHSLGEERFPVRHSGQPPVVATMCPTALHTLTGSEAKQEDFTRPALVIALDMIKLHELRDAARDIAGAAGSVVDPKTSQSVPTERLKSSELNPVGLGLVGLGPTVSGPTVLEPTKLGLVGLGPIGLGPFARITAEDPATVLQEALAAVCCVWPDIQCPAANGNAPQPMAGKE